MSATPLKSSPARPAWGFNRSPIELAGLGLGLLVLLYFVLHTGEIWEDFFITYRHSENLVQGHGLVFTPGERVHGFTSVFNTLLPAFFAWVTQAAPGEFLLPLQLYRAVSVASLLFAFGLIARVSAPAADVSRLQRWLIALFPLVAVLEIKITAFTMNGQEAGLMLGLLAALLVLAYHEWPRKHIMAGGTVIAGLMYTRPDGFVYIAIVALGGLVFATDARRAMFESIARSIIAGIILYLPWLVFTHFYYGSIIPHTIAAKNGTLTLAGTAAGLFSQVTTGLGERLCGVLSGIYDYQRDEPGAWPKWVHAVAMVLEFVAVTYWLVPRGDRLGRLASFCALLVLGYLTYAALIAYSCPWYYPPASFLSLLALWRLIVTLPQQWPRRAARFLSPLLAAGLVFFLGFIFSYSVRALRIKQEVIDWGHRRPLGLWLREHAGPRETVYLEPLGYIGYFSQRTMRDWPGLVSPEVVAARREIARDSQYPWGDYLWAKAAEKIQPDWIVARPVELAQLEELPSLRKNYRVVKVFNATEPIIAAGEFPGSFITYNDAVFLILQRQPERP